MKKRSGLIFTLVELLVVVSVMIILMSLLLPALKKSRETATLIKCVSNQKQLGLAFLSYSSDYSGYLPGNNLYWWCRVSNPLASYYMNNRSLVLCPALSGRSFPDAAYPAWYGVNYNCIWLDSTVLWGALNTVSITNPSGKLLLFCGHRQVASTSFGESSGRLIYAHGSFKVNLLYIDGHCGFDKKPVISNIW